MTIPNGALGERRPTSTFLARGALVYVRAFHLNSGCGYGLLLVYLFSGLTRNSHDANSGIHY